MKYKVRYSAISRKKASTSRIVVIGGGTGGFTVLSGLKKYPLDLAAVVSMADDGGSTGVLREEFGILPPGDIRRVLVALSSSDNRLLSDLFNYRFAEGGFKGHAFGNIMLTALERITGNFEDAVLEASKLLGVSGSVIPVTLDNVRLSAKLEDGKIIRGETNIDIPKHDGKLRIEKVWLEPLARISKRAAEALGAADMIVIGPGDLYTSVIPNLLVRGVSRAVRSSRAKKVFVVSTMTKPGETFGFSAPNYLAALEKYLGKGTLDYIIVNTKMPSRARLMPYLREGRQMVKPGNLPLKPTPVLGDFIRRSGFIRHDPEKLAKVLTSLI